MRHHRQSILMLTLVLVLLSSVIVVAYAITPLAVKDDPLPRMPGTQPGQVSLEDPNRCLNCHAGYNSEVEPGHNWKGSMMAQSARDFMFFAAMTVGAQDAMWATGGSPNATDLCLRCHFPKGWLEGRSEPTNAAAMAGADYDGVQCDFCHRMYDPFYAETHAGTREGGDWLNYWDETNASGTPSQAAADATLAEDRAEAAAILMFNGQPFFSGDRPFSPEYTEATSGQYFVAANAAKRASFADAQARHQMLYSRYHKSKYMCATCHDVSNAVLANLTADPTQPLPSEEASAATYMHVERTFSEFMLSAYGQQGGAPGMGPFAPDVFNTSLANNSISRCQDCHMRDVVGAGANKNGTPIRPNGSVEHPESGQPLHDLTGGNVWVSTVLASTVAGSPNYDATNAALLNNVAGLTLDLTQGQGIDPVALLDGAARAEQQLQLAASINNLSYNAGNGELSFEVQNQTGHKLISGFPEGRRMFVNIKAYSAGALIYEVNPYDSAVGTIKGVTLEMPVGANEAYADELVYEMKPSSSLSGEEKTFHFVLADGRYKDNRIPPKGFRISEAAARMSQPVWHGLEDVDYFTSAEYAGGYDAVSLNIPAGADAVEVNLYYQTTSREYITFLRDQINGTGNLTLDPAAYVAQTDPFFAGLKDWGNTIWDLWSHNMNLPGAAPVLMTQASVGSTGGGGGGCTAPTPTLTAATPGNQQVSLSWSDEHSADAGVTGYKVYYDQGGKAQFVAETGLTTSYTDSGLTNGSEYCYKVTTVTATCESGYSNLVCAIPNNQGQARVGVETVQTGKWEGKGKNQTFTLTTTFTTGDGVVIQATVVDASTGLPVANATVDLAISGPENAALTTGPSNSSGIAEATWQTQAPNRKGQGGTAPGSYTVTVTNVTASGYTWNGVTTSKAFTLQ